MQRAKNADELPCRLMVGTRTKKMTKKYYKLTDANMRTHNEFQWELGKWAEASGEGELCGSGWIHCYHHPLLAVLLNPIHANFKTLRLFEAEVSGKSLDDHGLKIGWQKVRLLEEISIPKITKEQKIRFGIFCALRVYKEKSFVAWAKRWLSGKDISKSAAWVAWTAWATWAAGATWATWAAVGATWAAAGWATAEAVAKAAEAAEVAKAVAGKKINLIAIAKKACIHEGKGK